MKFRRKLQRGEFVKTIEIAPPKGTDLTNFTNFIHKFKGCFDAFNVTDNQRAVLHMSSLAASKIILDCRASPIFQLTCRDRNRLALQSDILGAHALGIRNILALTGDHPSLGDHPDAKTVYDVDSVQLIDMINKLNNGTDVRGKELNGKTDMMIGAVVNPMEDIHELHLKKMQKKINNGTYFFQTQVIFDIEKFKEFLKKIDTTNIKIIAGIYPLKSAKTAYFLRDHVPGIEIPDHIIHELESSQDPIQTGIKQSLEIIERLKSLCDGIHLMANNNPIALSEISTKI